MAALFEGQGLIGKVVEAEFGGNNKGKPQVKWQMEVIEGPHAGKRASYSGKLDADSIKWTKRDMIAIGWQGKDVRTFLDDVAKANKKVEFEAQIASWTNDKGKEIQWTSARSIGFAAKPLDKLADDKINDVNGWFAEAPEIGSQSAGQRADDSDLPF